MGVKDRQGGDQLGVAEPGAIPTVGRQGQSAGPFSSSSSWTYSAVARVSSQVHRASRLEVGLATPILGTLGLLPHPLESVA